MKTPDVNVLVYAVNEAASQHEAARKWVVYALSGPELTGLTWFALTGFLRVVTNRRILPSPLDAAQSLTHVDAWLAAPTARLIGPGPRHFPILQRLMIGHDSNGTDVSDAHLAAVAIEHTVTLATFDSDFHRFGELELENIWGPVAGRDGHPAGGPDRARRTVRQSTGDDPHRLCELQAEDVRFPSISIEIGPSKGWRSIISSSSPTAMPRPESQVSISGLESETRTNRA